MRLALVDTQLVVHTSADMVLLLTVEEKMANLTVV